MALVRDNEIEMRRRKQRHAVLGLGAVDGVQDRGVGREHNPGIPVVLVAAQIAEGHIRQIALEIVLCLLDKRRSVRKEQDIRDIAATAQHIGQAGRCPGFAGTGRHDEQRLAEALLDVLADRTDGFLLIIAVGDLVVDRDAGEGLAQLPAVHQLFEIRLGEKTADLPLRC